MGRKTTIIPKAPMARILIKAGAKRVSEGGAEQLTIVMTEYAEKISEKAVMIAKHSGRKTVQEEDVKLAAKQ